MFWNLSSEFALSKFMFSLPFSNSTSFYFKRNFFLSLICSKNLTFAVTMVSMSRGFLLGHSWMILNGDPVMVQGLVSSTLTTKTTWNDMPKILWSGLSNFWRRTKVLNSTITCKASFHLLLLLSKKPLNISHNTNDCNNRKSKSRMEEGSARSRKKSRIE